MKLSASKFSVLFPTLLMSAALVSAQQIDFSGQWALKDQLPVSGTLYYNGVPRKISVAQQKDRINLQKTTLDLKNDDVITDETLFFNGQPYQTITPANRKKTIVLKMNENAKGFTATTTFYDAADSIKLEYRYIDTWQLDSAGNLTIMREFTNFGNNEAWKSKAIYEKQ